MRSFAIPSLFITHFQGGNMSVSIDHYIRDFISSHNQFSATKWIHDHPTAVKVSQVAGLV